MSWRRGAARTLAAAIADRAPAAAVITADLDGAEVVTIGCGPGDGFEIGSITKTMTGILLADAVANGRVRLTDPIGWWLDAGGNGDITLAQLATHTSGLPRLSPSHVSGAPDPYAFLTAEAARHELRISPRRQSPAEHEYSNFGFQILGLALERATGTPFALLLSQQLYAPLAMPRTGVGNAAGVPLLPGHRAGKAVTPWTHHLAGAGGVVTTANDMAKYLYACLMPARSPLDVAIELAQRPHHHIDQLRSVGLGWALGPPGFLGYSGGTSGFRSMLGIKTSNQHAAAILANAADTQGLAALVKSLLDDDLRP
jgi:D-alanyl-D-alanine-carboxypeptidase/D-alanyl-D-alanine-endopeptidase